jgi:Rne/Rng family ribonuclease
MLEPLAETSTDADLLDAFGIWDEIDRLRDPRAPLGAQAWIAIEPTTALVAVDINTGGDFSAAAGLAANLAAARELPRQLRLRGFGGQITVDMAPLSRRDRPKVEQALRIAFHADPVETTLAGWTPLGHFEIQRKRDRRPLSEVLRRETPPDAQKT